MNFVSAIAKDMEGVIEITGRVNPAGNLRNTKSEIHGTVSAVRVFSAERKGAGAQSNVRMIMLKVGV